MNIDPTAARPPADMSEWGQGETLVKGQSVSALPHDSDVNLFRDDKCIVHFNAQIPYGALDLLVAQQQLHGPEIASAAVD